MNEIWVIISEVVADCDSGGQEECSALVEWAGFFLTKEKADEWLAIHDQYDEYEALKIECK